MPDSLILDPNSIDYLYLVQQHRRLKLTRKISRLRPKNIILLPVILVDILFSSVCLWITNQLVGAMINEYQLLDLGNRHSDEAGSTPLAATDASRPASGNTGPSS
ncbi:hypothetical protein [Inquilinus sp. CA228]|uniref:hypothetical protein n=1 Tax=Inquilinus sp. CA228 TaxID=3455609 RepID=UPI003F8CF473